MCCLIMITLMLLSSIGILCCSYMLMRVMWIFRKRMEVLNESLDEYHKMPSYDWMINKIFVWDFEKLKNAKQK